MTEDMRRLIRGGEIAGYMKIAKYFRADCDNCIHSYQKTAEKGATWNAGTDIVYDSFDMGIKVGDEWWFAGDIFNTDFVLRYGEYFDAPSGDTIIGWFWEPLKGAADCVPFLVDDSEEYERIGSIYDKGK